MEPGEITAKLLALLAGIAPDIDPQSIVPGQRLRDQFDFDSMDTLHFAMAISREFGFDVAEKDYPRLAGVAEACNYVREKLESGL